MPGIVPVAHAVTCDRTILKESSRYVQAAVKARQTCEDRKTTKRLPASTDCATEPTTAGRIQKARAKLASRIAGACGGADKTCGTADDALLSSYGWGGISTCPNLENGACNNPIQTCADVVTCLGCVDDAAAAQAMNLYYGSLNPAVFGNATTVNNCQRAIGREAAKFLRAKSNALARCWDARARGLHANPCPVPGDGKAGPAIQKAELKMRSAICAKCGGADRACGNGDDVSTSAIGFSSMCPDVTVPGGPACAAQVDSASKIVACVDCVTEFKEDCVDALAVPGLEAYPGECNPTTTTTSPPTTTTTSTAPLPTTTTTTTTTTTLPPPVCQRAANPVGQLVFTIGAGSPDCGGAALSPPPQPPFSGELDDADGNKLSDLGTGCLYVGGGNARTLPASRIPDGATSVLDVATASGTSLVLAGSAGNGPADCTRGPAATRHCIDGFPGTDNAGACATDADCSGMVGSCDYDANCFFGPPVPVPNPAAPPLSVCIVNAVAQDICGTADLANGGHTSLTAALAPRIYLTTNGIGEPCPRCISGTCTGGQRAGLSCSGGVGSDQTTIECPPELDVFAGRLSVVLSPLSDGTSTASAASGLFCDGQTTPGAFGRTQARTIRETGAPLGSGGLLNPFATTLAGTFCIPKTGSIAIDVSSDIAGPGAVSIAGTANVSIPLLP